MRGGVVDVVIAGAGPTGLVLANILGMYGRTVLLVEANSSTVGEPRAVSIDDESLRTMQAIGLLDAVAGEIVAGYGSEYQSPSGSMFLKVRPSARPYGHARRNAFRQPVLERQLREALPARPTVEVAFGTRVSAFTDDGGGVTATLTGPEGEQEIRAAYLIGCDGARSGIREALGYRLEGDSMDERWLIVDLENSPVDTPETIVFCDARRPCIALPGPHLSRRYEFKVLAGEDEAALLADDSVGGLLDAHGVAPGSRIIRKTIYHFHARIADTWGRGRVWLAGDAAHLSPPFAGQGMNSGVRDAANVGWKLAYILDGRIGPGLLATYQIERYGHVEQMIRLALRMGSIMGPRTRLHGAMTRAAFRLLGLWPAARSYFAEMKYKPAPRFEDGFLLREGLSRRGVVGRMLPQPVVRSSEREGVLLDDVLGPGFVLLAIGLPQDVVGAVALGGAWDGLIARRVALPTQRVPELAEHDGFILLLRPDRYVMARFAPADADPVSRTLATLLERTWRTT